MKAAVITEVGKVEVLDVDPVFTDGHSKTCANGQVRVKILSSGICGAQLKEINGERGNAGFMPHMCGHEAAAIIQEVGPGVSVQLIGKKMVCHWRKGSGPEAFLPATYTGAHGLSIGGGHVTTLCEQAVISANRCTVVPDDVPDELCALLGCGLSTALGTIEQEAKVKFGESILIVGCGGVGLNLIVAAKLAQAWPIVGMDLVDKSESCIQLGASTFVQTVSGLKWAAKVFGLKGFDVIVDTSGNIAALEATMPLLADNGRYVMVGQPKPGEDLRIMGALDMFHGQYGKRIMTTQGGGFMPGRDIPRYISLWRSGALNLDGVISHRIPLQEVNRGIDLVRAGQAGRILVEMR